MANIESFKIAVPDADIEKPRRLLPLDEFDIKGGLVTKISSIPEKGTFFVSLGGGLPTPSPMSPQRYALNFDYNTHK